MMANNHQDFIEFVCKPAEDLWLGSDERRAVRIIAGTEYRCSMLRDQHFSSLFRHYAKHNGVDKETLAFFFTEELMQELEPSDTPRSIFLRRNDIIVIRHRHRPTPDNLCVRLDLDAEDALELYSKFPQAIAMKSADGRTALHHVAARGGDPAFALKLLTLGSDPRALDNYGRLAVHIAEQANHDALVAVLRPNELKRQMAVLRAQVTNGSASFGAVMNTTEDEEDPIGQTALRFLFSTLSHGNPAFERVVRYIFA